MSLQFVIKAERSMVRMRGRGSNKQYDALDEQELVKAMLQFA